MLIQIEPISSNTFRVTIEKGVTTTHEVHVSEETVFKLSGGRAEAKDLVRAAIEFLLDHESNTSIQRNFDIETIGYYFSEFEEEMRGKFQSA